MSEKTMRKWFKTFLMLLPFLFLAIFAIAVRKDGLEYELPTDNGYYIVEEVSQADENDMINIPNNIEDDYFYLYYDAADLIPYLTNSVYLYLGNFNDLNETQMRVDMDTLSLEFTDMNGVWRPYPSQSLTEYADEFIVDEILYASIIDFIDWGIDTIDQQNQVCFSFYINYAPTALVADTPLELYIGDADIMPRVLTDKPKETETVKGPQAVLLHFNDMINDNFNFDAFGLNDFYDWMNENWFNNEAPLIVKPVFTLLVYEAIIELIFLMFSFITFVIRFAQQWIDGIYLKGGKK